MNTLRLETMTQAELVTLVMRGGVVPDERTLAGIRIERLEGDAVRLKESLIRTIKAIRSGGLNLEGLESARQARLMFGLEYDVVMQEVRELKEMYFSDMPKHTEMDGA